MNLINLKLVKELTDNKLPISVIYSFTYGRSCSDRGAVVGYVSLHLNKISANCDVYLRNAFLFFYSGCFSISAVLTSVFSGTFIICALKSAIFLHFGINFFARFLKSAILL